MDRILRSSVEVDTLEIIDEYTVASGLVSVRVTGDGRYLVDEPAFSEQAGDAYSRIIDRMRESTLLDTAGRPPPEAERLIYDKFWEVGLTMYDRRELDGMFHSLRYYIVRDLTGYHLGAPQACQHQRPPRVKVVSGRAGQLAGVAAVIAKVQQARVAVFDPVEIAVCNQQVQHVVGVRLQAGTPDGCANVRPAITPGAYTRSRPCIILHPPAARSTAPT